MVPELITDETHSLPLPLPLPQQQQQQQQQHHDENCNDDHNDESPHRHVSVVLLCGLPGSGKTTNAKHVCSYFVAPARRRQESKPPSIETTSLTEDNVSFDEVYYINYDDITNYLLLNQEQEDDIVDESQRSLLIDRLVKRSLVITRKQMLSENDNDDNLVKNDSDNHNETNYFSQAHLTAWKSTRRYALEVLKYILLLNHQRQNLLIIMDDNFFLKSMRHNVIQTCRQTLLLKEDGEVIRTNSKIHCDNKSSRSVSVSMVVFDTPLEECLCRNELRHQNSRVPRYIIDKMSNRFEFPSFHDETKRTSQDHNNNHSPATTTVPSSNNDELIPVIRIVPEMNIQQMLHAVKEGILISRSRPLCPTKNDDEEERQQKQVDRETTLKNKIHQCDKLLRQMVGVTSKYDKALAKYANETRKIILEQYRRAYNAKETYTTDDEEEETVMFFETLLMERFFNLLCETIAKTNPACSSSIDLKQLKYHLQQTVLQQKQR